MYSAWYLALEKIDGVLPIFSTTPSHLHETMAKFVPRQRKHKVLARAKIRQNEPIVSAKQKRLDKYVENKLKKDENVELLKKLEHARVDTAKFQSSKHLGKRKYNEEGAFAHSNGPAQPTTNAGSGLKTPLTIGRDGLPIIQARYAQKKAKVEVPATELPWEGFDTETSDQEDWVSRDGTDSASESTDGEPGDHSGSEETSSSDDDSEQDDSGTDTSKSPVKPRTSAFKSWATHQINKSVGHVPSYEQGNTTSTTPSHDSSISQLTVPIRTDYRLDAAQSEIAVSQMDPQSRRKAFSIRVERPRDLQNTRMNLPIVAEEQKIMEAIHNNSIVFIWGATGSGKTTQLPQFLFEAGYGNPKSPTPGMIGITQPRRVAAVSMASRVRDELGQDHDKVAHQVRFDSSVSSQTAIKFMTDGILLRELSKDVMLSKYSVVVIDEAHERSVNTDVLIGMLSRIVPLRLKLSKTDSSAMPLKLVIMSATLRTSDFLQNPKLFKPDPMPPPLVQVEGRQFPVAVHFARRTQRDYLEEVCSRVIKGHRKLPHGGMLVFLTGQSEIKTLKEKLLRVLVSAGPLGETANTHVASSETVWETEDFEFGKTRIDDDSDDFDLITGLEENDDDAAWEEDGDAFDLGEVPSGASKVHILPLYSQLPAKEQMKVFQTPPEGSRLIILATNVAETSLTIPGIKYVFDAGRSKERVYDHVTDVQSFEVKWISKASAEQRTGRAGRTAAGHCYRLYSSAVYERDFPQHAEPELLRTPIESVVLQLKSLHVPQVLNFPFPTPPSKDSISKAEALLKNLAALTVDGRITSTGSKLSLYPISPRLSKMLNVCIDLRPELVGHIIAVAAALSVGELFTPENNNKAPDEEFNSEDEQNRKDHARAGSFFSRTDPKSDVMKLITAVLKYEDAEYKDEFCGKMFIRSKAMQEVVQLRSQLLSIVRANNPGLILAAKASLPTAKNCAILNEMVGSGYVDQVAIRADLAPNPPEMVRRPQRAIDVPYLPLMPLKSHPKTLIDRAIFLHPTSVLARLSPKDLPMYVVYSHLQRSQSSSIELEQTVAIKTRMFPLAPLHAEQLARLAHETPLLEYSKPIGHKMEMLRGLPQRRECWVIPTLTGEAGALGWPLPPRKVVQRKDASVKAGWAIETFLS